MTDSEEELAWRARLAPREVLRTPAGRWVWWPALDTVDFIPKGKHTPRRTVYLKRGTDNYAGAVRAATRDLVANLEVEP